jgi:hypothetical protein
LWSIFNLLQVNNFSFFRVILQTQQKILQISDFPKKQDSNPLPHGDIVADIAKMFAIFLQKSVFESKNTIFAKIQSDFPKIPHGLLQKLDSAKNFFPHFSKLFRCLPIFAKILELAKIGVFYKNWRFCENLHFL